MYNIFQGDDRSSSSLTLKRQHQRFVEILRKPFRRLPVPSSPILPPRSEGEGREEEKDTSQTDSEKVCGGGADDIDDDYDDRDDAEITLIPTTLDSHSTSNSSSIDGGYTVVSMLHTLTLTTGKLTQMHISKIIYCRNNL